MVTVISGEDHLNAVLAVNPFTALCFTASWSKPCAALDLAAVASSVDGVVMIDCEDDDDDLQGTYHIGELPFWVAFRNDQRLALRDIEPDMANSGEDMIKILKEVAAEGGDDVCSGTRSDVGVDGLLSLADGAGSMGDRPVPITLLSGFLGTGKTTTLTHILRNKEGLRLGVIVNDMAKMNVDAKVIQHIQDEHMEAQEGVTDEHPVQSEQAFDVAAQIDKCQLEACRDGCLCVGPFEDAWIRKGLDKCQLESCRNGCVCIGPAHQHSGLTSPAKEKAKVQKEVAAMVTMDNGCVCCSLREDLIAQCDLMARQAQEAGKPLDGIVIEGSGIAEPQPIAIGFVADSQRRASEMKYNEHKKLVKAFPPPSAKIDTLVTLVDSERFLQDYNSVISVGEEKRLQLEEGASDLDTRKVVKLLIDQVECANVIVLNKTDLVQPEQLEQLKIILSSLNPSAKQLVSSYGKVPLSEIIATNSFTSLSVIAKGLSAAPTSTVTTFMKSFVWSPSKHGRPLHSERLRALQQGWVRTNPSVLRSKGWVWCASRPQRAIYWSQAGNYLQLQYSDGFDGTYQTQPEDRPPALKSNTSVAEDVEEKGLSPGLSPGSAADWLSEIVIIGIGLDEKSIRAQLEACVLTDAEFELGESRWISGSLGPDKLRLVGHSWDDLRIKEEIIISFWVKVALVLSFITIIYNLTEGVIAISMGVADESVALMGFGVDSFVEVVSACFVLARLCGEKAGAGSGGRDSLKHHSSYYSAERIGTFCIGILLIVLALSAFAGAVIRLLAAEGPSDTLSGIIISAISLFGMFFLYYFKMYAAVIIDSSTLEKDAACSLGCIQLSATLFISSLLTKVWPALWWLDSAAAIILALVFFFEGKSTLQLASRDDFDGCVCCASTNSWLYARLKSQLITPAGYLKGAAIGWGAGSETKTSSTAGAGKAPLVVGESKAPKCFEV